MIIEREVGIFVTDNKALCHNEDELSAIAFGSGFGGITDIETGPNGSLYVLSVMTLSVMIMMIALSMRF